MPRFLCLVLLLVVSVTPTAAAEGAGGWAFSLGVFDIADNDKAVEGGVEYRWLPSTLWVLDLEPVVGLSANSDGSFLGYGGLRYDFELGARWAITPQFAVSLYEDGSGKDLGGLIEFRSGLEISYRLDNGSRIGLVFYHLSNSRIYELNPGEESLALTWSLGR